MFSTTPCRHKFNQKKAIYNNQTPPPTNKRMNAPDVSTLRTYAELNCRFAECTLKILRSVHADTKQIEAAEKLVNMNKNVLEQLSYQTEEELLLQPMFNPPRTTCVNRDRPRPPISQS